LTIIRLIREKGHQNEPNTDAVSKEKLQGEKKNQSHPLAAGQIGGAAGQGGEEKNWKRGKGLTSSLKKHHDSEPNTQTFNALPCRRVGSWLRVCAE